MLSFEKILSLRALEDRIEQLIPYAGINTRDGKVILVFEFNEKKYRVNLWKYLWGGVKEVDDTYVATRLIREGYLCFPIEGGWVVVSPKGEEYTIVDNQCTCPDFLIHKSRCKHLVLRDWVLNYRARCNNYRRKME